MIAKSSWFSVRKYGGWGLTPNCWQGWLYIIIAILPVIFIKSVPFQIVWGSILTLDIISIFLNLKKDERETLHEAIADRNSLWLIVLILALGMVYQIYQNQTVDPVIFIALIAGALVKTMTNLYLRDK